MSNTSNSSRLGVLGYKPWKVTIVESDRFRGQEVLDKKYFSNEDDARNYAKPINDKNVSRETPECYIFATVEPC